jgi:hypothetical protein
VDGKQLQTIINAHQMDTIKHGAQISVYVRYVIMIAPKKGKLNGDVMAISFKKENVKRMWMLILVWSGLLGRI